MTLYEFFMNKAVESLTVDDTAESYKYWEEKALALSLEEAGYPV